MLLQKNAVPGRESCTQRAVKLLPRPRGAVCVNFSSRTSRLSRSEARGGFRPCCFKSMVLEKRRLKKVGDPQGSPTFLIDRASKPSAKIFASMRPKQHRFGPYIPPPGEKIKAKRQCFACRCREEQAMRKPGNIRISAPLLQRKRQFCSRSKYMGRTMSVSCRAGLSKPNGLCYNITLSSCLPDRVFALKNTNLAAHFVPS